MDRRIRIETYDDKIFSAMCVTDFLLWIEWGISTSMLPLHIHDLGGSPLEVGLVFSLFAGICVFAYPFWGGLSDYLGKRKIFIVSGMAALFPLFLLIAFQEEAFHLILLRGSTAIFKGAVVPTIWALASDISPPEQVGSNMGVLSSIEMAGFALGPVIGGLVTDVFGYTALWIFVATECLLGALMFFLFGSDIPRFRRKKRGLFPEALDTLRVISKISVLCLAFIIFLLGFSLLGPNLNVYLFADLGLSRTMVGVLSFIAAGITTLIQPFIGSFSDKYGRKPFLLLSALNLALGNVLLFLTTSVPLVFVARILISNYNIFKFIGSAYIADVLPQTDKSGALGLFSSVGSISRSLGAIIGGYVITATNIPTLIIISSLFPILSIAIILIFLLEPMNRNE